MPGLLLAALVVVGTALRLYRLSAESVWLDEAFSITIASGSVAHLIAETARDVHPPLYYLLLHPWVHAFGTSEWTGRLLSVVFGVGLIAAIADLARLLANRRTALIAAALVACSPFLIRYAQEARMYALLVLLGTTATAAFVRLARRAARPEATFGLREAAGIAVYTALATATVYTHVYGFFALAAHAVVAGLEVVRRGTRAEPLLKRWGAAMAATALLFMPWLETFGWQVIHVETSFWIPSPEPGDMVGPLVTYAGSTTLLYVLGPLAAIGAWRTWHRPTGMSSAEPRPVVVLAALLLCPVLLPFALSHVGSSIFLTKYTIVAAAPFAVLAAAGLAVLPRLVGLAGVVAAVWLSFSALGPYYQVRDKDDWRSQVARVEARAEPGDVLVFYPFFTEIPFDFYRTRADLVPAPFPRHAEHLTSTTLAGLTDGLLGSGRRAWLVVMDYDVRTPVLVQALSARFGTMERLRDGHVDVYLFDERRGGPARPGP